MAWSFPIGRLFGSQLRVHATFFLLLLWIGVAAYMQGGPGAAAANLIFVVALFMCVIAHEFGHALMARRYGIATPDITLLPIGGLARLERMPRNPKHEIAVALAGPVVNIVIWAAIIVGLGPDGATPSLQDPEAGFWARLATVNLYLAVFNMIPAFPMDGGRVLRAALSVRLGRVRATKVAARAGQGMAFVFGFLGLMMGNPVLVLIALFIFIAAGAESADVAMRDMAHNVPVQAAMITTYEGLEPHDTLAAAGASLLRSTQAEFPVLHADGTLAGLLTRSAIFAAAEANRTQQPVSSEMETDIPTVQLGAPLTDALDALLQGGKSAVAVVDRHGHFLGYINRENIGEFMVVGARHPH